MLSPPTSPPRSPPPALRFPPAPEAPKESAVSRFLIAPLTFISFLISLALIDSQNHNLRTHSHSPSQPAPTTTYGKTKAILHSIVFKPATPYAYVKSPNIKAVDEKDGKGAKEEQWYWHTKQKKMMKAEVSDAFRIRNSVMVVLVSLCCGAVFGTMIVVRWITSLLWSSSIDSVELPKVYGSPGQNTRDNWLGKDW